MSRSGKDLQPSSMILQPSSSIKSRQSRSSVTTQPLPPVGFFHNSHNKFFIVYYDSSLNPIDCVSQETKNRFPVTTDFNGNYFYQHQDPSTQTITSYPLFNVATLQSNMGNSLASNNQGILSTPSSHLQSQSAGILPLPTTTQLTQQGNAILQSPEEPSIQLRCFTEDNFVTIHFLKIFNDKDAFPFNKDEIEYLTTFIESKFPGAKIAGNLIFKCNKENVIKLLNDMQKMALVKEHGYAKAFAKTIIKELIDSNTSPFKEYEVIAELEPKTAPASDSPPASKHSTQPGSPTTITKKPEVEKQEETKSDVTKAGPLKETISAFSAKTVSELKPIISDQQQVAPKTTAEKQFNQPKGRHQVKSISDLGSDHARKKTFRATQKTEKRVEEAQKSPSVVRMFSKLKAAKQYNPLTDKAAECLPLHKTTVLNPPAATTKKETKTIVSTTPQPAKPPEPRSYKNIVGKLVEAAQGGGPSQRMWKKNPQSASADQALQKVTPPVSAQATAPGNNTESAPKKTFGCS